MEKVDFGGKKCQRCNHNSFRRYSSLFLIDLMDGVKLECRPNAMTEESTPLYARTGKVVVKAPFPEDVVRCHACIQAFRYGI